MREITQSQVQSQLIYDPKTGIFRRKVVSGPSKVGDIAGCKTDHGYIRISVLGNEYRAHRLAWLYVYGHFPEKEIDHINGDRMDNRIENLRAVSHHENMQNIRGILATNRSGLRGVCWVERLQKWRASISLNGKAKHIGVYSTKEQAHDAYVSAKKAFHHAQTLYADN